MASIYYVDKMGRASLSLKKLEFLEDKKLCPDAECKCLGHRDNHLLDEVCAGKHKDCGEYFLRHKDDLAFKKINEYFKNKK